MEEEHEPRFDSPGGEPSQNGEAYRDRFTIAEASRVTGKSTDQLRRAVKAGKIVTTRDPSNSAYLMTTEALHAAGIELLPQRATTTLVPSEPLVVKLEAAERRIAELEADRSTFVALVDDLRHLIRAIGEARPATLVPSGPLANATPAGYSYLLGDLVYDISTTRSEEASMKAIIYLRVSTEEPGVSGLGLEAQEAAASDYCARQGFEIVEVVREVQSGKSTKKRPQLMAALVRCRQGEAGILIVSNVSHLSRSIADLAVILEEARKRGYSIVALDTGLDTTTSAGKMVFQILGVAVEYERAMTSDRTKEAPAAKKARGEKVGRTSTLDRVAVKMIQAYRLKGLSFGRIAEEMTARGIARGQGGAKWYAATVRKVLLANGGEVLVVMPKPGRKGGALGKTQIQVDPLDLLTIGVGK